MKSKVSEGLSVIVPVFNETSSVKDTISGIGRAMEGCGYPYEIVVVDDGSTDSSSEILSSTSEVAIFTHPQNRGYGASLKTGIRHSKYDVIGITDADGTYPAKMIPELYRQMDGYDMVIGARNGETVVEKAHLRLGKFFIFGFASLATGHRITDLNSGLRIFKKSDILQFFDLLPDGFSFTSTSTVSYLCTGRKIRYVSIDYYSRSGKSKMKPIRDGYRIIRQIARTVYYFNPTRIYMLAAIIALVILTGILLSWIILTSGEGTTMLATIMAYVTQSGTMSPEYW